MADTSSAVPEYARPPVVEVVFSVTHEPAAQSVVDLAKFGIEYLGYDFPVRSDHPPVSAMGSSTQMGQTIAPTLSLLTGMPLVRLWFQSNDKTRLVQLQRNWLACNWQGSPTGASYPRYSANEEFFLEIWDSYVQFTENMAYPALKATMCELTYINHINPGDVWTKNGELSKVIRLAGRTTDFLPDPEDGQLAFRYRISLDGQSVGWLRVQVTQGFRLEDHSPIIQLQLVAQGAPLGEGRDGMLRFFRLAHEWIVNGFAAVTTETAQDLLWERKR